MGFSCSRPSLPCRTTPEVAKFVAILVSVGQDGVPGEHVSQRFHSFMLPCLSAEDMFAPHWQCMFHGESLRFQPLIFSMFFLLYTLA